MKTGLLLTMTLLAGSFPVSLAQSKPSQPVDPTAQAPSTLAPSTPPTFPPGMKRPDDGASHSESAAAGPSNQEKGRTFIGTIVKERHEYILKAADVEYLLDDHGEARKYKGKRVKVTGNADENHMIHVKMIELSPPM
jgi:Protein of unknown function (DUF5818)